MIQISLVGSLNRYRYIETELIEISEWLLVSHGIFQGLFAILIAFWGNRIHKIQWLCGLVIFESVTSFLVIIPTIVHAQG